MSTKEKRQSEQLVIGENLQVVDFDHLEAKILKSNWNKAFSPENTPPWMAPITEAKLESHL